MPSSKTPIAVAVAGGLALAGSVFSVNALAGGYMQDAGTTEAASAEDAATVKDTEGKCSGEKAAEGTCGIAQMDTDEDGRISKAEFAAAHDGSDEKFASHDPNNDGFIDAAEMEAHHAAKKGGEKAESGDKSAEKGSEAKGSMEGKCGEGKCGGGA